ncbi:MAG: hypothetical protein Q9163_002652 [Psora crenata]
MANSMPKSYHSDPQLYLYTSLSSGSSSIVTATSRLQTILKANKITFQALDVATDEKARTLWVRWAGKRRLPGLVRMGMDLEQVEEWNEYGEVKEKLQSSDPAGSSSTPTRSSANTPSEPPATMSSASIPINTPTKPFATTTKTQTKPSSETESTPAPKSGPALDLTNAMRQAGLEAAKKAGDAKKKARTDALEATIAEGSGLGKLGNSIPTGMEPPSGTAEAGEPKNPEKGGTVLEDKADDVPATRINHLQSLQPAGQAMGYPQETPHIGGTTAEVPTPKEVEEQANKAIVEDQTKNTLEGVGQAVQEVPTANEAEEMANQSIIEDEEDHVHNAGQDPGADADVIQVEAGIETPIGESTETEEEVVIEESEAKPLKTAGKTPEKSDKTPVPRMSPGSDTKQESVETTRHLTGTSEPQGLPRSSTQDQPAASAAHAGQSVAD